MCAVDKMISCEVAFTPLGRSDYITCVDRVLGVIKASGLPCSVGDFSTAVKGEKEAVFGLVRGIYDEMEDECGIILDVKISNVCGCAAARAGRT